MKTLFRILLSVLLAVLCLAEDEWPCPVPSDIAPCVCATDSEARLILTCDSVDSDEDLIEVFKKPFPIRNFYKFTLNRDSNDKSQLRTLPEGLFGPITFELIYIENSELSSVHDNIFDNMSSSLRRIQIIGTNIDQFPFDDINILTKLEDLYLQDNHIKSISNLSSNSLGYMRLDNNVELFLSGDEFLNVPNLYYLHLDNIGLNHINADLFSAQNRISSLYLNDNKLEYLPSGSFHVGYGSIYLRNNEIATIEPSAFTDFSSSFDIDLQNNLLEDIPEDVWLPIFEEATSSSYTEHINLNNNPILCGCNLKWLLTNPYYMIELVKGTTCHDGTLLVDIDADFIEANCP